VTSQMLLFTALCILRGVEKSTNSSMAGVHCLAHLAQALRYESGTSDHKVVASESIKIT